MTDTPNWRWKHFSADEMRCRCGCGAALMMPAFMDALEAVRAAYARPMRVTSGYRCPAHNAAVSGSGPAGPHTTGRAVDIAVHGADALLLAGIALEPGRMTGLGVMQKGPASGRYLHLDDLAGRAGQPRPWLWSY